jgi:hypothetical protein
MEEERKGKEKGSVYLSNLHSNRLERLRKTLISSG